MSRRSIRKRRHLIRVNQVTYLGREGTRITIGDVDVTSAIRELTYTNVIDDPLAPTTPAQREAMGHWINGVLARRRSP